MPRTGGDDKFRKKKLKQYDPKTRKIPSPIVFLPCPPFDKTDSIKFFLPIDNDNKKKKKKK